MRWHIAIFTVLLASAPFSPAATVEEEIHEIIDAIFSGEEREYLPTEADAEELVIRFYERRNYRPAWEDRALTRQVLGLIASSNEHGLNPADYHYPELMELVEEWEEQRLKSNRTLSQFDVLLTDGMLLFARHLIEGKVDPGPLEYSWNYSRREFQAEKVIENVSRAIDDGTVAVALAGLAPDSFFYRQLQQALAFYRELQRRGPFVPVPGDKVLRLGDRHPNVAPLRQRLLELDFMSGGSQEPDLFDGELELAVKSLQEMHGLRADGIVGRDSFAVLNTPHARRIEQIRVNLDRIRWVQEDVSENYLVVNIAGFELYYIKNEKLVWNTEVMTGKVATETPMFRATIKYLVFNPTWTVPRSIIRRSLYGKFASNPDYARENNFKLYDSSGTEVLPAQLDWSQLSRSRFPYRVVQQPGPHNSLGRVKFMFPNKHAIYLHDTPHRELFDRSNRAFSAGCIRVQYPLELAEILLADPDNWRREQIEAVVESEELKTVHLANPVDVLLMYWTASPTATGRVKFHADIYDRDATVLKRLDAEPDWKLR
jgi:murein L,D-transpeptidase YcbB/YkuD